MAHKALLDMVLITCHLDSSFSPILTQPTPLPLPAPGCPLGTPSTISPCSLCCSSFSAWNALPRRSAALNHSLPSSLCSNLTSSLLTPRNATTASLLNISNPALCSPVSFLPRAYFLGMCYILSLLIMLIIYRLSSPAKLKAPLAFLICFVLYLAHSHCLISNMGMSQWMNE